MSVPPLMIARIADDLIKQIDFREKRTLFRYFLLNFTKFYMRILFKVKDWRICQVNFATNIISHTKEKCPMNMMAEENKGKKKKFKEGQAEQVLDDLFFEAIKGVERLKECFLPSVLSTTSSRLLSVSILLFHKNLSLDSSFNAACSDIFS
jgi:hypothetical protein